jgi:hypothetical protein
MPAPVSACLRVQGGIRGVDDLGYTSAVIAGNFSRDCANPVARFNDPAANIRAIKPLYCMLRHLFAPE